MRNQAAGRRKPCCAFLPCPDMTYCSLAEADSSTYAGRPGCLKSEHISLDFQGVLCVKALRRKKNNTPNSAHLGLVVRKRLAFDPKQHFCV